MRKRVSRENSSREESDSCFRVKVSLCPDVLDQKLKVQQTDAMCVHLCETILRPVVEAQSDSLSLIPNQTLDSITDFLVVELCNA